MDKPVKVESGQMWRLDNRVFRGTYVVLQEDGVKWKLFCLERGMFGWESEQYMLLSKAWEFIG